MAWISAYIGVFTGLLIAGMGIYLYRYPVLSGFPAWVQSGLPIFMMIYGGIRFGFSLYKIWQQRRNWRTFGVLILGTTVFTYCQKGPETNLRLRFDYAGDCAACPLSRMDSLLRLFFPMGVISVSLDSAQNHVILDLDSHYVRIDSLRQVLLVYGYEIDEDIGVDPILSSCCLVAEASTPAPPLAGPSPSDIQEDMTMLERELEQELGVTAEAPQLNLDAELNLDEELGLEEELDLGGGLEMGEDLGLEDLDIDLELDLEEPKPTPKKSTQSKP